MNASKVGSWIKAVAAICAAIGLYTFTDKQVTDIEVWIIAGWAMIDGGANAFKGWNK